MTNPNGAMVENRLRLPALGERVCGSAHVVELREKDASAIVALEQRCWSPELRASRDIILGRMELGHTMLGIDDGQGALLGLIAGGYATFSPDAPELFPTTFEQMSKLPVREPGNACLVYSLHVDPHMRDGALVRLLIDVGVKYLTSRGYRYVVGHARCPSYNGSDDPFERPIRREPIFRSAVDRYLESGNLPSDEEITIDPVLRFYRRIFGCTFWRIIRDFWPIDRASGGMGAVFYRQIQ
jgi:hypothetical protein